MLQQHPITPPPELLQQWAADYWGNPGESVGGGEQYIATQAARWGADVELEACCWWLRTNKGACFSDSVERELLAARRPNPPGVAQEGLRVLVENGRTFGGCVQFDLEDVVTIRRALERLQELENNG